MNDEVKQPLIVLVVDDDDANRYVVSRHLRQAGFAVKEATTGTDALKLTAEKPDLVILDIKLPDISGYEVCQQLKANPMTASIPILHLSALKTTIQDKVQGLDSGADGYLTHPVEPLELIATIRALLRIRQAEEALGRQEKKYRHIFEAAGVSIWEEDFSAVKAAIDRLQIQEIEDLRHYFDEHPEFVQQAMEMVKIIDVNQTSLQMFEAQDKSELLISLDRIFVEETLEVFVEQLLAIAQQKSFLEVETVVKTLQGKRLNAIFTVTFPSLNTNFDSVLTIVTDITERKRAEEKIQQQAEELAKTNRLKDEFLATLSHELRSPLNAILGWSQLLRSNHYDTTIVERALETIERNAKLQTQLVEDLLDVSRIIRGKIVLNSCPINLGLPVQAAIATMQLAAQAKSIQIRTTIDTNLNLVSGDPDRLQQVVWNLLSNAIKFTPTGGEITIRLDTEGAYNRLQVSDTGKGISAEFLPHIFEYFRQEDSTITRTQGGLGLGLAIVRHLVELHGGTVDAQNLGESQGATFTILLPSLETNSQLSTTSELLESIPDLKSVKLLLVDDEPDGRQFLTLILEQYGALVTAVGSAKEAIESLERANFDVFISDIGMPDKDGYTLLKEIRTRSPERGGCIPAIALTAYAREEDRQQALSVGFQKHLSKPIEPSKLITAIASIILGSQ